MDKGLVSYVTKNKTKFFSAVCDMSAIIKEDVWNSGIIADSHQAGFASITSSLLSQYIWSALSNDVFALLLGSCYYCNYCVPHHYHQLV